MFSEYYRIKVIFGRWKCVNHVAFVIRSRLKKYCLSLKPFLKIIHINILPNIFLLVYTQKFSFTQQLNLLIFLLHLLCYNLSSVTH